MKSRLSLVLALTALPFYAAAHTITVGQPVPNVDVNAYGEIVLQGEGTAFQPWNSQLMLGKVRVIQAIAGRSSAKEMNAPLMSAITQAQFPSESYQTTTIINQDDAMWGTGSFVKSSALESKTAFPWSSMVLDESGVVASAWQLAPESSAIVVQNKQGDVLFVKEGALNNDEISRVITLIREHL
ncbi:YtfJ family protein [Vibrio sp. SM6]|uniref:YtfJ family protein n=1 Tax=Vibrio agarilyticus TaxID=2726741 RepID=A0A7X8TPC7_9VIBR|nr:YtfJ family protein [Vibrio agarilyticus]NLS12423.1 YtfJ family protein [Vibrio agarilyticus]